MTEVLCAGALAATSIAIVEMWRGQAAIAIGCIREGVPAWWRGVVHDARWVCR